VGAIDVRFASQRLRALRLYCAAMKGSQIRTRR
jgi:hypothetical protein